MRKNYILIALLGLVFSVHGQFDDGILNNGDFELGSDSWHVGVNPSSSAPVVTDENGNKHYSFNVTSVGQAYTVNTSQFVGLINGETYTLTFDAWSDTNRSIIAGIGLSESPWSSAIQTLNISPTRTTYSYTFENINFGDDNARVLFDLGADTGRVNLDNVALFGTSACGSPSFTSSNPTADGISFTWNQNSNIDSYVVEISTENFIPGDGTATSYTFSDNETQPYVITGLDSDTVYRISIKSKCGDTYSSPIGPNALLTLWDGVVDCPPTYTLPYLNDFGSEYTFSGNSEGQNYGFPMMSNKTEFTECNSIIDADAEQITASSDNWGLFGDVTPFVNNVFAISFSYDPNAQVGLNPDNYMILGPFDLQNMSSASLSWKVRSYDSNWANENYTVYVSTSDEVNDILQSNLTFNERLNSSAASQWNSRNLDLSSQTGNLVYITFRHHNSYNQNFLAIDDIALDGTLGIKSNQVVVEHYYDAYSKTLSIESASQPLTTIAVYDLSGRLVHTQKPSNSLRENIDFNNYTKGIYLVEIHTNRGAKTIKVLHR